MHLNYSQFWKKEIEEENTKPVTSGNGKKAIWKDDYDFRTDKIYSCPGCPDCFEPFPLYEDENGNYYCCECGETVTVDSEMQKFLEERKEIKEKTTVCFFCEKNTMQGVYKKNPVTHEWQFAYGECKNPECGCKTIV